METVIPQETAAVEGAELDLIDIEEVCTIIGGSKPVNRATIYRGIATGKYPKAVKVGPNISRWLRSEWLSIVKARIAERHKEATAA
jgi:predicted DNA-binding transcriptional regulator AlpA